MAHLKTKATTSNLTEREQWKWNLVRPLYQRGLTKFDVINLVGFIDKMMTLSPSLQLNFNHKLNQYEKELNMPFLTTIEEMALERGQEIGQEKGAKETYQQNIINLFKLNLNFLKKKKKKAIKQIDDLTRLKQLHLDTIRVNSVSEFEQLVNDNLSN